MIVNVLCYVLRDEVMCELVVVRMAVCDVVVVVMEFCGVNDCVMTGGSVEMTAKRLPWLVTV